MNAGARIFVDTNVLLYQLSGALPEKQARAEQWMGFLWDSASGRISWQVLHEFYVNAVMKLRVPPDAARTYATRMFEWKPASPTPDAIQRAWHWCDTSKINFWDALIVAAAEQTGCHYLLSEDFQTGRRFDAVAVIDPFARTPTEFLS